MDALKNFAYTRVTVAPSPATTGTVMTVEDGLALPDDGPFDLTVWPADAPLPLRTNATIVRVTSNVDGVLTMTRNEEESAARAIVFGDQVTASLTKKYFTDLDAAIAVVEDAVAAETSARAAAVTATSAALSTVASALSTRIDGVLNTVSIVSAAVVVASALATAANVHANTASVAAANALSVANAVSADLTSTQGRLNTISANVTAEIAARVSADDALSVAAKRTLASLNDVSVTSAVVDQVLRYNGATWVNDDPFAVAAGDGVDLFYAATSSDVSGYQVISPTPDAGVEADESVVANNNTVLIRAFATPSGGLGGTAIDAGTWEFNVYGYASLRVAATLQIAVYKRTAGGVETQLFTVNTAPLSFLGTALYTVQTVQQAFAISATDRLVIKVSGVTTNVVPTTIHFVHSGTSHYSNVQTPMITRHNDLAGLQGGTASEYFHLTSAELAVVDGATARLDAVSASLTSVASIASAAFSAQVRTSADLTSTQGRVDGISANVTSGLGRLDAVSASLTSVASIASAAFSAQARTSADLTSTQGRLDTVSADHTSLKDRTSAISSNVTSGLTRLDAVSASLTSVASIASAAASAAAAVSGNHTSLVSDVGRISANVASVGTRLDAVSASLTSVASIASAAFSAQVRTSADLTSTQGRLDTVSADHTSLKDRTSAISSNVTSGLTRLDAVSASLTSVASIASAAFSAQARTSADLTSTQGRLDAVSASLTSVASIASAAFSAQVRTSADLTSTQGRLDGISANVTSGLGRLDAVSASLTSVASIASAAFSAQVRTSADLTSTQTRLDAVSASLTSVASIASAAASAAAAVSANHTSLVSDVGRISADLVSSKLNQAQLNVISANGNNGQLLVVAAAQAPVSAIAKVSGLSLSMAVSTYQIEGMLAFSTSGAASVNFGFSTSTAAFALFVGEWRVATSATSGQVASGQITHEQIAYFKTQNNTQVAALPSSGVICWARVQALVRVTTPGSIQMKMTALTGGPLTILQGSYLRCFRIG